MLGRGRGPDFRDSSCASGKAPRREQDVQRKQHSINSKTIGWCRRLPSCLRTGQLGMNSDRLGRQIDGVSARADL